MLHLKKIKTKLPMEFLIAFSRNMSEYATVKF